jgi:hypothetical protein
MPSAEREGAASRGKSNEASAFRRLPKLDLITLYNHHFTLYNTVTMVAAWKAAGLR